MNDAIDEPRRDLVQVVQEMSALLDSGYKPVWTQPRQTSEGCITLPFVDYDSRIWAGIHAAMDLLGVDFEYLEHIEEARGREIGTASATDLSTWFTFMSRGERFCDGFLSVQIDDGTLDAITKRLEELIVTDESLGQ